MTLLSRTAENLYWLSRYMERADSLARTLDAAFRLSSLPTTYGGRTTEWESAIVSCGCADAFRATFDAASPHNVVDFVAFSPANPSSIRRCFEMARANANLAFDLAREMCEAKTLGDLFEKTITHQRRQIDAAATQLRELSALTQKVVSEATEPIRTSITEPFKLAS